MTDVAGVSVDGGDVPSDDDHQPSVAMNEMDELIARHKAESKTLQNEILIRKKAVNKTDKKKKKELQAWIATEEAGLSAKQEQELARAMASVQLNAGPLSSPPPSSSLSTSSPNGVDGGHHRRVSKAEKRRDKKAQEARDREARLAEAEAASENSERSVEQRQVAAALHELGLDPFPVPPDGDCLFQAVSHQLSLASGVTESVSALRKRATDELRRDEAHFGPFVASEDSGVSFDEYCRVMETTPAWGGHVELEALSKSLRCAIKVVMADGDPLVFGSGQAVLTVAYYRHAYGLGEHYESTLPMMM